MSFYVLSKAGDTFINVESFEYVYVADDDTIKAIAGQRQRNRPGFTSCPAPSLRWMSGSRCRP